MKGQLISPSQLVKRIFPPFFTITNYKAIMKFENLFKKKISGAHYLHIFSSLIYVISLEELNLKIGLFCLFCRNWSKSKEGDIFYLTIL